MSELKEIIEMCQYYTTTGYPTFKPLCEKGYKASLRCHSTRRDCPDYNPSQTTKGKEQENG